MSLYRQPIWANKDARSESAVDPLSFASASLIKIEITNRDLDLKPAETAFFSFIIFKNKAHRNAVNKKVMAEMNTQPMPDSMPFDVKRMAYGGFKTLVQG